MEASTKKKHQQTPQSGLNVKTTDDLIRQLGHPGRFQILIFLFMALNYFPIVFHHVSMAFYGYTPPFQCHPEFETNFRPDNVIPASSSSAALTSSYSANDVAANDTGRTGLAVIEGAKSRGPGVIFRGCDVIITSERDVNRTEKCEAGQFRYGISNREKTVVMEWDLVCDQAYLTHLTTTVYYCGVMLGGFACGYLSDYFGRRPVILATLTGLTLLGTGLAFVRNFPVFVVLRFLLGFLTQGFHAASYIMAVELFPAEERTMAGCIIQCFWGGAVLAMGGVAWIFRDWRHIQLAISLPSILAVSYFWLVPESLRWLLAKGKRHKAERLIQRIAAFNRLPSDSQLRTAPESALWNLLPSPEQDVCLEEKDRSILLSSQGEMDRKTKEEDAEGKKGKTKTKKTKETTKKKTPGGGSVKDLFSTTVMLKRSMVLFYIWFSGNLSYFGLTFMSTSLAGNRFLNYTLIGAVELFAYAINIYVIRRFGRRNPLCFYFSLASVSCLGVGITPTFTDNKSLVLGFSVLGKFATGGCFTVLDLLTVEMFPTVLRNVGAGLCSFWGRFGAVVAPQCLNLGLYTFSQLPPILIGALTLLGALVTLLLPDTSHVRLPDTVYEITLQNQTRNGKRWDKNQMEVVVPLTPHSSSGKTDGDKKSTDDDDDGDGGGCGGGDGGGGGCILYADADTSREAPSASQALLSENEENASPV